ncbi:MAG: OsmC family protein [Dehalococcoidia bacterium]
MIQQEEDAEMTTQETLNGLHPEKLSVILESMKSPDVLKAVTGPWKSRVVWQGGFRSKAYMRKHTADMDEPEDLDATDMAASAHEHLLSAVGSCITVGFVLNATKRGVKIADLEIALEGYFDNILKWAGIEPTGNPGYGSIKAKVFVKADADEATLREIWKLAVEGSPVTQSVARTTQIIPEFEAV